MGEWTPGPWTYHFSHAFHQPPQKLREAKWRVHGDQLVVADVYTYGRKPEAELEANARLIAAAPEMADLLENFASWQDPPYGIADEVELARALLSRIRGADNTRADEDG